MEFDNLKFFDININLLCLSGLIERVERWIKEGEREGARQVIVSGFHGLYLSNRNKALRRAVLEADVFVPDGIAPIILARMLKKKHCGRVTGYDFMNAFFEVANDKGYKSFFLGDTDEVLDKMIKNIECDYPGHKVAGKISPPFRPLSDREESYIVEKINESKPDILWVGLGMPKQEIWIHRNLHRLQVPVAAGVGAAFKFFSGHVKRAPEWIGEMGFEWVWRFFMEPHKLWRRDIIDGPQFIFQVVKNWDGIRKENS